VLDILLSEAFWEAALRVGTPVALAALAALVCSRAGILYVGIEGVVLIAAFFSIAGTIWTDSAAVGLLLGIAVGSASSVILGFLSMRLTMGDVIAGVVYHFGSIGVTGFLWVKWFPEAPTVGTERIAPISHDGGALGLFLHQTPIVYAALALTFAIAYFLRTSSGLRLRACGEAPAAAAGMGIDVVRIRYLPYAAAGALAGLSGAFIGLVFSGTFDTGMVSGRGYVALACFSLAAARPGWTILAALLFGAVDAYRFQADLGDARDWFQILPFVLTIVVVAWVGRRRSVQAMLDERQVAGADR
jgi:simple sugar transport system permease protein